MKRSIIVLLASSLCLLVACSNNSKGFAAAPQDADKGSVVYVYRPGSSSNFMYSPKVAVDDNEKFSIGSGDYRYMYLPQGKHTVVINPTRQYETKMPVKIQVEPGKSYYLRVSTLLKFEKQQMNTRLFWIEQVAEQEALTEIAKTDYAGPKSAVAEKAASKTEKTGGFSVGKTQDPFAGKYNGVAE